MSLPFLFCSYTTWFRKVGLTEHVISTKMPFNFRITFLSARKLAWRHVSGMSATATSLRSLAPTTKVILIDSRDVVGHKKSSLLLTYRLCYDPFVQVCPFNFPHLFSFMRFTVSRASPLPVWVRSEKGMGSITVFPCTPPSLSYFN